MLGLATACLLQLVCLLLHNKDVRGAGQQYISSPCDNEQAPFSEARGRDDDSGSRLVERFHAEKAAVTVITAACPTLMSCITCSASHTRHSVSSFA
jgi:hypothetical protein